MKKNFHKENLQKPTGTYHSKMHGLCYHSNQIWKLHALVVVQPSYCPTINRFYKDYQIITLDTS